MSLLITKTNSTKANVRKTTLSQKIEFGAASLICITILMVCGLSLMYLTISNKKSTRSYELQQLEKMRAELLDESRVLNAKFAKVQSLNAIKNDPIVTSMNNAKSPLFIRGDTAVASIKNPFYN